MAVSATPGLSIRPQKALGSSPVPKILVTCASKKAPQILATRDAARRLHPDAKVVAGDIDPNVLAAHVADEFWLMPRTTEESVEAIVTGCAGRAITCVLPTRDAELSFWARHASRFREAGVSIVVSPLDSIETCIDKFAFSEFGRQQSLPVIPSALSLEAAPWQRYVVKERRGAGSRSIGIGLDRAQADAHARTLSEPIFQPFLSGAEISVDAWLDRTCRLKGLVLRRRDLVIEGESQITTTFRSPKIESDIGKVLATLRLCGPVVVQALLHIDGSISVIECNARLGGASTAGIAAGLQSLHWSFLEAHGGNVDNEVFERVPGEVRLVRVPSDLILHDPRL
jgi:carbamoyl-phosphate synthase large subunit